MCSKFLALIKLQSMCCIHSAMFHIKKKSMVPCSAKYVHDIDTSEKADCSRG